MEYYIDGQGNYLGGFSPENAAIPQGAVEVPAPPAHGWQKWDAEAGAWLPLTAEQQAELGIV